MFPGDRELELTDGRAIDSELATAAVPLQLDVRRVDVTLGRKAKRERRTLDQTGEPTGARVITVDNCSAILLGKAMEKFGEGAQHVIEIPIAVAQMLGLHVGDNCHLGIEMEKTAIELIRFDDKMISRSRCRLGLAVDPTPNDDRGVEPRRA